tara:strand:+ start:29268 stop:29615 length:348 start_codon:yes stop_codon:yes gene_type:complete
MAIILSLDYFDDEKSSSKNSESRKEQRMMPDMMRPTHQPDPRMIPDMMRPTHQPDPRMIPDVTSIQMTIEDYELIIQELELRKKYIQNDIALEQEKIDLEIQRITNEKNKLKSLE